MKVRELKSKLARITDNELEVIIRCSWEGNDPAGTAFVLRSVSEDMNHDTTDPFLALDCDQNFDDEK